MVEAMVVAREVARVEVVMAEVVMEGEESAAETVEGSLAAEVRLVLVDSLACR